MSGKAGRIAAVAALSTAVLVVPMQAASAADSCGSGWHKQSDGHFIKSDSWSLAGGRSLAASHSGWVRYCTKERSGWWDDENRRVLIGVPYPLTSHGSVGGAHKSGSFCLKQTIKIYLKNVDSGSSVTVTGSTEGYSVSTTTNTSNPVVTMKRGWICPSTNTSINASQAGAIITGPNSGATVEHVELITSVKTGYSYNGTTYAPIRTLDENDYSSIT